MTALSTRTTERRGPELSGLPCLVAVHAPQRGQAWWLDRPLLVLGRDSTCSICIEHDSVSRRHAELRLHDSNLWLLTDLGSKNGTRLNDKRIGEASALVDGDLLTLGAITLQFLMVQAAPDSTEATALTLQLGPLKLDPQQRRVWLGTVSTELTETESLLLAALMRRPNRVLSLPALMRSAWRDASSVASATVTSHMRNLRQKLRALAADHDPIRSVYGQGYVLQV